MLHLLPQCFSGILGIQLGQLAQNFLRPLVTGIGGRYLDLDNLVAAHAFLDRRGNTLLAQAQLLSTLRARRDLQKRAAIDGGNFDLAAQSGFRKSHRHREVDIVAIAFEKRMLADSHHDVKIAGRGSHGSGVAAARQTNALPITRASLDAHLERFVAFHSSRTVAKVADGPIFSAAAATRAGNIELHAATLVRNLSFALALGTDAGALEVAASVTAKHRGENVFESAASGSATCCASAVRKIVEIEAPEVEGDFLATASSAILGCAATTARVGLRGRGIDVVGVEAELVVDLALLGIAEDVVGLGERFELLLRGLVPGIHVGVILASQLAEGLANVLRRGSLLDPENPVVILVFVG